MSTITYLGQKLSRNTDRLNILVETLILYKTKENKMKLLQWIKSLFITPSYQEGLDRFISSKNPTNTAEVEHWIRLYDTRKEWAL